MCYCAPSRVNRVARLTQANGAHREHTRAPALNASWNRRLLLQRQPLQLQRTHTRAPHIGPGSNAEDEDMAPSTPPQTPGFDEQGDGNILNMSVLQDYKQQALDIASAHTFTHKGLHELVVLIIMHELMLNTTPCIDIKLVAKALAKRRVDIRRAFDDMSAHFNEKGACYMFER